MRRHAFAARYSCCLIPLFLVIAALSACSDTTPNEAKAGSSAQPIFQWSGSMTVPLLTQRGVRVGDVTASIDGAQLVVKYVATAPWSLVNTEVDIENDWHLIPHNPSGKPMSESFAFSHEHALGTTEFEYRKPLSPGQGPTLFIAAHAEVAKSPQEQHQEAWAAGTRFTEKEPGHWETYFGFTPQAIQQIAQGNGWVLTRVSGTVTDTGKVYDQNLYMISGAEGISDSPLPQAIKDDLANALSPDRQMFIVDQQRVREIEQAMAVRGVTSGAAKASSCFSDFELGPTFTADSPIPAKSFDVAGGITGKVAFSGNIHASASAKIDLHVLELACVPYGIAPEDVHVFGNAVVGSQSSIQATLSYSNTWSTDVAKPTIIEVTFLLFDAIPVVIGVNVPITVGVDLSASTTGSLTYAGEQTLEGSFDYRCTLSGCSGNTQFNADKLSQLPVTAGISGRVQVSPWVQGAVRAYLYTDSLDYGQIGIRPEIEGDFWGYYGNDCGDANGDGIADTVDALTFDTDWQVFLTAGLKFGTKHPEWNDVAHTDRRHISFFDLIGSSAMTPMLLGPAQAPLGVPQEYQGQMRTCWPYTDSVHYDFDWGDGTSSSADSPAQTTLAAASHAWQSKGLQTVVLNAVRDAHGRTLGHSTTRPISVGTGIKVSVSGTGGVVTSNPAGINCPGSSCSALFPVGTQVTLSVSLAPDYLFDGWSGGGCSGTGPCTVTISGSPEVTASFSHTCGKGWVDCNNDSLCETDNNNDRNNCGACGRQCSASQTCQAGTCVSPAWTPWTSEEYSPINCLGYTLVDRMACHGSNCDDIRAYCDFAPGSRLGNGSFFTSTFSDEDPNGQTCPAGAWLTGISCSGSNCDNMAIQCSFQNGVIQSACGWISSKFSDEEGDNGQTLPPGTFAAGLRCTGNYCDNMYIYACSASQGGCTGGWMDCDGNSTCETDSNNDRNNCGACGRQCSASQTCQNGICVGPAWTPWTSEEFPPVNCLGNTLVDRMACRGSNCDDIRAYCDLAPGSRSGNGSFFTSTFSDETPNGQTCPAGAWLTGISCSGTYCDNMTIQCSYQDGVTQSRCDWYPSTFSDEDGDNGQTLPAGTFAAGLRCTGNYCDNMDIYACSAK